MPQTPSDRTLRSKPSPSTANININGTDIKALIEDTIKTQIPNNLVQQIEKLSNMLSSLLSRIDDLTKKTSEIEKHCSESHARLDREIKDLKNLHDTNLSEIMQELEQRSYRSGNIIIFGLPEQCEGTVEERKAADLTSVNELLSSIDTDFVDASLQSTHRLGKPNKEKPRPLRITGLSIAKKSEILRASKSLRGSRKHGNVFINPDLTPRQQQEA